MTEQFDPYRKWLGIPERDQPPHHYRLLGIEPFEDDQEVIANAADARMAHIKTFQAGKHSDHSQRLLNELAAAKVCLLTPAKKAEYDRLLRAVWPIGEAGGASGAENAPPPRSDDYDNEAEYVLPPPMVVSSRGSAYIAHGRRKKQPTWIVPFFLFAGSVSLAIVLYALLPEEDDVSEETKRGNRPAAVRLPEVRQKPTDPSQHLMVVQPDQPSPESEPREKPPREEPSSPQVDEEPEPFPDFEPGPDPDAAREPEPAEPVEPAPVRAPSGRAKLPPPDAAAQREAEDKIRAALTKEFARADNAKLKSALAAQLRGRADRTRNDPAARFVLYRLSAELSAASGDLAKCFETIDRLADRFEVDSLALKVELAAAVAAGYRVGVKTYDDYANLWINANTLLALADAAVVGDDFASASQASKLAVQLARATKNADLLRETAAESRAIELMKPRFRPVEAALNSLALNPDDGEANLTAGRWRCFAVGDWHRGLPLLAKGSDATLADLARRDLAHPQTADERLSLGDAWLAAAVREQPPLKNGPLSRAYFWIEQAAPSLPDDKKTEREKQLAELRKQGVRAKKIRGHVVKGNVASHRRGATIDGASDGELLIDGQSNDAEKFAVSKWPCRWIINLNDTYSLRSIRFRLPDADKRFYRYVLSVSSDGENYEAVKDAGQGSWSGWQQIAFSGRPVKTILLEGLYHSLSPHFHVVELEAYCIPSERSIK